MRTLLFLLVLGACCCSCLHVRPSAETPEQHFDRAVFIQNRLFGAKAAAEHFAAIADDPAADRTLRARALRRLATCQSAEGQNEAALATLDRLLADYADQADVIRDVIGSGRARVQQDTDRDRLQKRLKLLVIPEVTIDNLPPEQAFNEVAQLCRQADPAGTGFDFVIVKPSPPLVLPTDVLPDHPPAPRNPPAAPSQPPARTGPGDFDFDTAAPPVTVPADPAAAATPAPAPAAPATAYIHFRRVTAWELLEVLTVAYGWRFDVTDKAILIGSADTALAPLVNGRYWLGQEFADSVHEAVAEWRRNGENAARTDFELFFSRLGIPWSIDSAAIYEPQSHRLLVYATQAAQDRIHDLLNRFSPPPLQVSLDARIIEVLDPAILPHPLDTPPNDSTFAVAPPQTIRELHHLRLIAADGKAASASSAAGPTLQVTPTVAADHFTIDLELVLDYPLPTVHAAQPTLLSVKTHLIAWDGESQVWQLGNIHDHPLVLVLTPTLIDPAGTPIRPQTR